MAERAHRSIGEVLNLLQDEFPDVTISKIRFLESQGLIDPERTPSGYRKFYDDDVKRLRWILREQRENFLPLKVIKERLERDEVDFDEPIVASVDDPTMSTESTVKGEPAAKVAARPAPSPRRRPVERAAPKSSTLDVGPSGISLTQGELVAACGLSRGEINELERYGLLASRAMGDEAYYDEDALVVAKLAADFKAHGVEARHLRMYKVAAEREAGFFEQVVMPLMKQRDPQARAEAIEMLERLTELGDGLRAAMLRQAMHEHLAP